jgi:hypothetical protein
VTVLTWWLGLVLVALGVLHIVWAFGGLTSRLAVVPERDGAPLFRPSRGASLAVALLLLVAAMLVMQQGGALPYLVPAPLATLGCWTIAMTFTARAVGEFRYLGFFKRVRGTRFARWDTRLFSPLCLALGIGTAVIASR